MPEFTPHQLDAIEYRRLDACVVAGPGSGKTTVLVERYRSLIEDHGFEPRNILAITFTEKAAANMKAKLAELFVHDPLRLRELESAYVSTIHGFCARVLRENAIAAGIDPRFIVLDARESDDLQFSCIHAALDELVEQRREQALDLIEALQTPYLVGDLRSAFDGIRSAGKTVAEVRAMPNPSPALTPADTALTLLSLLANWPPKLTDARQRQRDSLLEWAQSLAVADAGSLENFIRLIKACPLHLGRVPESEKEALRHFKEETLPDLTASAVDRHTARFRALIFDVLTRFDELYAERKLAMGALDFNDLERRTVDLLHRKEDVRTRVRAQFRQVMLDEFQDINEQQSELIQLVRGNDVFFAVGDVNQSIYGFRHARPEIFHQYRAHILDSRKHAAELLHNFRSRTEILRCVESLLNAADGIDPRQLIAGAPFAEKATPSIEVLKVHATDDRDEAAAREARWISHRILSLRGVLQTGAPGKTRSVDFADFAVLCRNGDSMRPILDAFDHAGIPYVSGRRQSFLLSREGRDITALLHVIANPRDAISLATVLRSPLVGLSDEALLRVRLLGSTLSTGLNVIAHDPARLDGFTTDDARKIDRFARDIKRWRAEESVLPLELVVVRALTDCGFQWTPGTVAADNVESLLYLIRTRGDRGLLPLLSEIESLQDAINLESDLSDKDQGNSVQVMTAHSAKGLEFPVTIIAAMDKGTQRNAAPVTFTPNSGLGMTWSDRGGKRGNTGLDDSWQRRNAASLKDREKQEAHRLLYVAMTRAEEHLVLSYSRGRNRPSNWAKMVDELFQLDARMPSDEASTVNCGPFEASILVTDGDPPLLHAAALAAPDAESILTIPRPAATGQHDSAVNVTSLAVFADCPRKYFLQRYIGWNTSRLPRFDPEDLPPDVEENAADLGSAVHEILAGKPGPFPAEAQRLANVFLASPLAARAATGKREWEFIIDLEGTLVRGSVDLWFEDNGEFVVLDYKTDNVTAAEATERAAAYAPQLALYGLAIERAAGKRPTRALLHFLRPDTVVEVPLDFARVGELLSDLRAAQDNLQFELREAPRCRTCQFHHSLCPAA